MSSGEKMETRTQIEKKPRWAIILGVSLIVLGIIAIASPVFISLAIELVLGCLFIIGGVFQIIYAFQNDGDNSSLWLKFSIGLLSLILGILLIANPFTAIISITLLIGIFLFADGVFRVFLAFQIKPRSRWTMVLLNGIASIILGILIWSQWPFNAPWVLGILVGIDLIFNGAATLVFAIASRSFNKSV